MAEDVVAWIANHILPHEADVRRWLRRWNHSDANQDDVIQEAYCRLASISSISHIGSSRAYFFTTVRNLLHERLRREHVVHIETIAEITSLRIADMEPSAERRLVDGEILARTRELINELPPRCRNVFILRRIEGLSQRQTAERLQLTENVVEKEVAHGLKTILRGLSEQGLDEDYKVMRRSSGDRTRNKRGN